MSPEGKNAGRTLAARVFKDPTSASVEDARKMARWILLYLDGKLPK